MADSIIFVAILFLALLVSFLIIFKKLTFNNYNIHKIIKPPYTVLTVKNNEDSIEGIMRFIINEMRYQENNLIKELIVVDMGSCDNTISILQKFSQQYDFVHILSKEEYINTVGD